MSAHPAGPTRRDILRLLGVGAAAAALPGCSKGGGDAMVTWQAIPSYSLQGTDPKRVAYLEEQRAAYESASGYRLDPQVTAADTAAAMAKLLLQASQNRAPEISQVDGYVFGRMSRFAQPLTEQMAVSGLQLEDWFPTLQTVMTGEGSTVRGLQFTTDVRVLYHRKDLVPEPPATWEELVALAKPLAEQGTFVTFPGGRSEGAVTTTLWPQYWAQGADLFDDSGEPAFTSGKSYDAMRAALGVVQQCVNSGISPNRVATFGAEDDQNADIVAGRVAMFVGGNWQAAALNNLLPEKDFFTRFGVAPIPTISGQEHVTSAGGWVWAGFTDNQDTLNAGIDWVTRTFVGDDGMASWCSIGGYLPPRQSIYDNPAYTQNPFTPVFREHLTKFARGRPADRKYLDVSNSMQIALSAVASGSKEPDQALDNALNRLI
jgi:multiple sugar transport system substrate-binding protein